MSTRIGTDLDLEEVQRHTVRTLVVSQAIGAVGVTIGVATASLLARDISGSETMAGPMDCAAQTADTLEPLLAGEEASAHPSGGVDPYAPPEERLPVCGTLSANALPDPAAR